MVCLRGVFIIFFIYFGTWLLSNGITMQNSRLQIGRILTIDLIGQKMCENQCLTYPDCKAINFNKRHLSCELMTHSGQEAPEHLHFEGDTVHIYNITKSQVIILFISIILVICRKEKRYLDFVIHISSFLSGNILFMIRYKSDLFCFKSNTNAPAPPRAPPPPLLFSLCKVGSGNFFYYEE